MGLNGFKIIMDRSFISSYWLVVLIFPLYGVFSFLRNIDMKELGYVIFILPVVAYIAWYTFKAVITGDFRVAKFLIRGSNRLHSTLLLLFIISLIVGILIAAFFGSRPWIIAIAEIFMLISLTIFLTLNVGVALYRPNGLSHLFAAYFMSLSVYVGINVIAAIAGFESLIGELRYSREFEAIFSPFSTRIFFPFTLSGQYFSIIAGILIILSFTYPLKLNRSIFRRTIVIFLGVFVLISHSARAPILALFIVFLFSILSNRYKNISLYFFVTLLIFFPFVFIVFDIGGGVDFFIESLGLDFSRSEGDVSSLSNRDLIWSSAFDHMQNNASPLNYIFGYGAYSHITSGVVREYSWLFSSSYVDLEYPHFHSSYIQVFMDFGVIGMIFFIFFLWVLIAQFLRINQSDDIHYRESSALMIVFFYICICAVTEVIVGYFAIDILLLFLVINMFVMAVRARMLYQCTLNSFLRGENFATKLI